MNKYVKLHSNMRFNALFVMAIIAFLLLCSESHSNSVMAGTKAAGLTLVGICYWLGRRWHRAGKLQEVDDFVKEEERP